MLRDPLVHFLLLGSAAFFVLRAVPADDPAPSRAEIVVTVARAAQLEKRFEKTWNRPPSPTEREQLIEAHLREEVFYREAVAAGLDKDDDLVRRRMQKKFEFLIEDISGLTSPTEDDLRAFHEAHADRYRIGARFWFRHIFFSPSIRKTPQADARALLATLKRENDGVQEGDALRMVEPAIGDVSQDKVERIFGKGFAADLLGAQVGEWSGPIQSGFGVHLVRVDDRKSGGLAPLADVRAAVEDAWRRERRSQMFDALYRRLRAKYTITVESNAVESE